jgi:hypothetical protein
MKYEIQSKYQGNWSPLGGPARVVVAETISRTHENEFDTREEAQAAIEELRKLGDDWAKTEYRIVEIPS